MEKFLFKKEEKKERTIYLMGAALFLLVLSIIFFVIGKTKAKKDKLSGPTLLLVASFLCFSVALFVVALVIMLTPNILETRPTPKESNPGQDERRELESDFVQYHVYQVKNTRMNMCMTAKKKPLNSSNDDPHRFTILVAKCDQGDEEQLFTIDAGPTIWDDVWGKGNYKDPCRGTLDTCFELHPLTDPKSCLNNPHHPKEGEKLMSEDCKIPRARGHQTHRWELTH